MMSTHTRRSVAIALLVSLAGAASAFAQDTLAHAKDLYASAAYDEALVLLDRLHKTAPAYDATEIAGYEVFCLLALGRTDDAREAIEKIVTANPLYHPSEANASPKTRALFEEVRQGLLPGLVQSLYDEAKAAYDKQDSQIAVTKFDQVIALLNEPGLSSAQGMADLRRLATGFRDLANVAVANAARAAMNAKPAPVPVPPPAAPRSYSAADRGVSPPVAISRTMPVWRPRSGVEARQQFVGLLELVIDESGSIVSATIRKSAQPDYDKALTQMTATWKFRPATKDGAPVRYHMMMEFRLGPPGSSH